MVSYGIGSFINISFCVLEEVCYFPSLIAYVRKGDPFCALLFIMSFLIILSLGNFSYCLYGGIIVIV
jgi:hypothetical protein